MTHSRTRMAQVSSESFPLLIVRGGPYSGREFPLGEGHNIVGRGDSADVSVPSNQVSRQHARVDVREHGIYVVDLGSKNGVYVDGSRVPSGPTGTLLRDGGRIELGDLVLELDDAHARVAQALVAGGEITITRRQLPQRPQRAPSLLLPLLTAFGFAVGAYLLWALG